MEMNKEREAFESVFTAEKGWDLTFINECYQNIGTFKAFAGWKAAKEHVTPEGFVLELEKGRFVKYELIDLLTRSLSSSKVLKTNTNWVHVVRMLNVGSTVAHRICEKLGVDPESTKFEAKEQSHDSN